MRARVVSSAAALVLPLAGIAAGEVSETAAQAVTGTVTVVSVPWSFPSNRIDWLFNPTEKTPPFNPEWTWQLNRMSFWEDMAKAYRATRDEKYARAFAVQLRDWLDQTGGVPPESGYNGRGSPWRTIEEGLRLMYAWPTAEHGFKDSPAFTPELKKRFVAAMRAQGGINAAVRDRAGLLEIRKVGSLAVDVPGEKGHDLRGVRVERNLRNGVCGRDSGRQQDNGKKAHHLSPSNVSHHGISSVSPLRTTGRKR